MQTRNILIVDCFSGSNLLVVAFMFALFAPRANAERVYSANGQSSHYTGTLSFSPFEIGNQVTLAGTSRRLDSITVMVSPQGQEVVADFKFRFYANDGPDGAPGTLLGESSLFEGVHLSGQYHGVGTGVFLDPIDLPDNFTWTVQILNATPIPVGLPQVIPPAAVGESLASWFGSPSAGWSMLGSDILFDADIHAHLAGDFNRDDTVDAADYVVWRKTDRTQAGYDAWAADFNRSVGPPPDSDATAIPEPASLVLHTIAALTLLSRVRRKAVAWNWFQP